MRRIWLGLTLAVLALTLVVAGCKDAAQDTGKGAKNATGIAKKMKGSAEGEGGGDATSDD